MSMIKMLAILGLNGDANHFNKGPTHIVLGFIRQAGLSVGVPSVGELILSHDTSQFAHVFISKSRHSCTAININKLS
jgi:hypothetical protein